MSRYIIWHDADYDLALWLRRNTVLKTENVLINEMPKTNKLASLVARIKSDDDVPLMPLIKYEHPDLVLIEVVGGESRPLCVAEFMTHTPQWQHPAQRFARIYGATNHRVPAALVAPYKKSKMEKSRMGNYDEVVYKLSPSVKYLFQVTSRMTKTPAMIFAWTDNDGYLKLDRQSPTAPYPDRDIVEWFNFVDKCVQHAKILSNNTDGSVVTPKLENFGSLAPLGNTEEYLASINVDKSDVMFSIKEQYVLFSPQGLSPPSGYFRTDPYAGMLCAFDNMFCRDLDDGSRYRNLFLRATNVSLSQLIKKGTFSNLDDHDEKTCPFETFSHDHRNALEHIKTGCPFTGSKQQRIYGQVADLINFDDCVYSGGV